MNTGGGQIGLGGLRLGGRLMRQGGAGASAYAVDGIEPVTIADFSGSLNGDTPYFKNNGSETTFSSLFSFSRADTAYYFDSNGVLQAASSGTARTSHYVYEGGVWVNKGILYETEARTNLIADSDDMSGWTTSNMTVAKNQTGADGNANAAHLLSATSGNATVTLTVTASSNDFVFSALVKRVTGSGTIELTMDGGTTWVDVTSNINSSAFIQVGTGVGANTTDPNVGFRIVTSGDEIAVQINQLEQTSRQFSSPIPTSGGTDTRVAESLSIASASLTSNTTAMSFNIKGELDLENAQSIIPWNWAVDGSNYIRLQISSTYRARQAYVGTFDQSSRADLSAGIGVAYNSAQRNGATFIQLAESGTSASEDATPTNLVDVSSVDFDFLAYMGTIDLFRKWDVDLGTTGIETAST